MKKTVLVMLIGIMAGVFLSCASSPPTNSLGEVEAMFESTDVLIGATPQQSNMMNQAGKAIASGNSDAMKSGGIAAGIGLAVAATQEIANIPIKNRLNEAAREALFEKAKEQYGENIDFERIRFTLISQNPQTKLYLYTAIAFVVPAKEEETNKNEFDSTN